MKNLYHHSKNKGKVHPSPSSSSATVAASGVVVLPSLSALSLLPAAILALASLLSLEDREVLCYLITRSINTNTTNPPSSTHKKCKKSNNKHPLFDCGCFDCYTSYWFRWDSSPNRELINQAIEDFEDYLTKGEKKKNKKSKVGLHQNHHQSHRRCLQEEVSVVDLGSGHKRVPVLQVLENESSEEDEYVKVVVKEDDEDQVNGVNDDDDEVMFTEVVNLQLPLDSHPRDTHQEQQQQEKGLVRKVLPDVLGLFSSRLWSLWRPNA